MMINSDINIILYCTFYTQTLVSCRGVSMSARHNHCEMEKKSGGSWVCSTIEIDKYCNNRA